MAGSKQTNTIETEIEEFAKKTMGELTFFLLLSGLAVIIGIALYSYYIHHKKIRDEVQGFGHHANQIDDVLLQQHSEQQDGYKDRKERKTSISEEEMPESFSAKSDERIDLNIGTKSTQASQSAQPPKKKKVVIIDESVAEDFPEEYREQAPGNIEGQSKITTDESILDLLEPKPVASETKKNSDKPATANPAKPAQPNKQPSGQVIKMAKEPLPEGVKDLIIAMAIKKSDGEMIQGQEIITACSACNIHYGEMNIFHYPADNNPTTYALFSIANMLEPGTFDLDDMNGFSTSGLSLFMQLPLPMNCLDAYDIFLEKARLLAKFLNADLYDEKFNLVTSQAISHNKEKINKLHHEILKARKLETS